MKRINRTQNYISERGASRAIILVALLLFFPLSYSAQAAFDVFLNVKDIPGECTDDKHKDWISVLSFSHGIAQTATTPQCPGGSVCSGDISTGKLGDFTIVKQVDKASTKLSLAAAKGTLIPEVKLELCHATGDKSKYMEYLLTDVVVVSVRVNGQTAGSESLPLEEVSFRYGKIDWTYTEYDNKGKKKGDIKANWDVNLKKGG